MRFANIIAAVAVVLWFGLVLIGHDLAASVVGRTGGNVNINQFDYYVLWPASVVALLLGCAWACNLLRRYWLLVFVAAASVVGLLPFLIFYGGGV